MLSSMLDLQHVKAEQFQHNTVSAQFLYVKNDQFQHATVDAGFQTFKTRRQSDTNGKHEIQECPFAKQLIVNI